MVADAREIVPRLRRHPSLAIWCGATSSTATTRRPSSPRCAPSSRSSIPSARGCRPLRSATRTCTGPWEHQGLHAHYEHYDGQRARLHSEFGVEGMTNRRALEELIDEEHRWPADRTNPGLRASRRLVEQRAARAGGVRRADRRRRDDAPREPVAAVRGSALRSRGDAAARRRGDPVAAQRVVPQRVVHVRGRLPRRPEAGVLRRRPRVPRRAERAVRDLRRGAASAGARAVSAPARFVDLDGSVVAESTDGEIAAPLDAFATDVFLLDLAAGANRYVMTRTENLEPLLDLPQARIEESSRLRATVCCCERRGPSRRSGS